MRPLLVTSAIYRGSTYGPKHPLAIPRVPAMLDLCAALGWLPAAQLCDSPRATEGELARFHEPAYIAALARAEADQAVDAETRARFGIGANGNPVYREVFRRPATAAGGTLLAARLTASEGGIVYNPGGGTHHGMPGRASGFCYVNDPVLGLLAWRDTGLAPLLYVDIDAHHGDGVEEAFANDPSVFTLSVHEAGRWPGTGAAEETRGGGAMNIPVPPGFNDSELRFVLERAILPVARALRPAAIMLQGGADALAEDPLADLALSNTAHWAVVAALARLAPRFILLGGGGYNPWSVARCWAGAWATLNGWDIPDRLPEAAEASLRALTLNRAAGRPGYTDATARLTLASGARIDVAGTTDTQVSVARQFVTTELLGSNDLRDAPLQKDGPLFRSRVTFDLREGVPILGDASVYREALQRSVSERLAEGGSVALESTGLVALHPLARVDVSGGRVEYLAANVAPSVLLAEDGRRFDLNDAPADLRYTAIEGVYSAYTARDAEGGRALLQNRWGLLPTYSAALLGRR